MDEAYIDIFRNDSNMPYFVATLWQVYSLIEKPEWKEYAQEYSQLLLKINDTGNSYDNELVKGVFMNSFVRNANQQSRAKILEIISGYIEWEEANSKDTCISHRLNDCCFEELLENQVMFFATKETGDPLYRHLAIQNSEKIYSEHFQNRHSNELFYGLANWENLPGLNEIIKFDTREFYNLALCFYGYTLLYHETGIKKYLDLSDRLASLFILIFEDNKEESIPTRETRFLIEKKVDLISRIFVSLALKELDIHTEKDNEKTSKRVFASVVRELGKTDISDDRTYNFRMFYFLFEYLIRQHSTASAA